MNEFAITTKSNETNKGLKQNLAYILTHIGPMNLVTLMLPANPTFSCANYVPYACHKSTGSIDVKGFLVVNPFLL